MFGKIRRVQGLGTINICANLRSRQHPDSIRKDHLSQGNYRKSVSRFMKQSFLKIDWKSSPSNAKFLWFANKPKVPWSDQTSIWNEYSWRRSIYAKFFALLRSSCVAVYRVKRRDDIIRSFSCSCFWINSFTMKEAFSRGLPKSVGTNTHLYSNNDRDSRKYVCLLYENIYPKRLVTVIIYLEYVRIFHHQTLTLLFLFNHAYSQG